MTGLILETIYELKGTVLTVLEVGTSELHTIAHYDVVRPPPTDPGSAPPIPDPRLQGFGMCGGLAPVLDSHLGHIG